MKILILLISSVILLTGCSQVVYPTALAETKVICAHNGGLSFVELTPRHDGTDIEAWCRDGTVVWKRVPDEPNPSPKLEGQDK